MQLLTSTRLIAAMSAMAGLFVMSPAVGGGASLVFYTSASGFNAAEPGLPVESFNNANVTSGTILLESSPVSSATSNSIFAGGSILPGLTVSNLNPKLTPGLIVYGNGAIFGGTKTIGTNWFGDSLVLSFAPGVSAVAADVFAATSPGQTLAGSFTADVYNGSTLLGSTSFTEDKGAFGFFGVSSSTRITSVNLLYTTDDATTFADNIAFGGSAPPPSAVPEPSTFIICAALFCICIAAAGRRRSAAR